MSRVRVRIINEPTLVIEDFTALGQISMVSALTVLQSMDYATACLPVTIFSTQTECFGTPKALSTASWMKKSMDHWKVIPDLDFNGALIGYLRDASIVPIIKQFLQDKLGNRPVLVDPVMGDEGKLYPGFQADYVQAMQSLCQEASIITPNWTELCFLANQATTITPTREHAAQLISELQNMGINAQVVISGIQQDGQNGCFFQSREEGFQFVSHPQIKGHFYGTGDTFAALLIGYLLRNESLTTAVTKATAGTYLAVKTTAEEEPAENWKYGLKFGRLVASISNHQN